MRLLRVVAYCRNLAIWWYVVIETRRCMEEQGVNILYCCEMLAEVKSPATNGHSSHLTSSLPLCWLSTASRCQHLSCTTHKYGLGSPSSLLSRWSRLFECSLSSFKFCGKENVSEEVSAMWCLVRKVVNRVLRLDKANGAKHRGVWEGVVVWTGCRSMSRSSSESRSSWLIKEKPEEEGSRTCDERRKFTFFPRYEQVLELV